MGVLVFVGLAFVLLSITGVFIYFLKTALNTDDSKKIDPVRKDDLHQ